MRRESHLRIAKGRDFPAGAFPCLERFTFDCKQTQCGTDLIENIGCAFRSRRVSGTAASATVTRTGTGAALVYAAPYAVIVQASQPWLGAGITAAVPQLEALYARQVTEAWN